jgi:Ammonia permease
MSNSNLLIAANTIWVVVAAILVMFMQAGFAFLEAGLTRMKNAAHIAGKNVLIFGICSLVYWLVGFGIAFGDGNSIIGTHGFAPSVDAMLAVGKAPYSFFTTIPGAGAYLFEVVFAGVSLAIVWGAMAERAKLWVYFVFGVAFTLIYSVDLALDLAIQAAGCSVSGCRTSPARPSSTTRARSPRSPARSCSAPGSASSAMTGARIRSLDTTCPTPSWER